MLKKARRLVSSSKQQPVVLSIEKAALKKQAQVFEVANPEAEASGKLAQNTQRPSTSRGAGSATVYDMSFDASRLTRLASIASSVDCDDLGEQIRASDASAQEAEVIEARFTPHQREALEAKFSALNASGPVNVSLLIKEFGARDHTTQRAVRLLFAAGSIAPSSSRFKRERERRSLSFAPRPSEVVQQEDEGRVTLTQVRGPQRGLLQH